LWNLRKHKITGSKVEYSCEIANITCNKNTIKGDKNAMSPYGIRLGTPALTTRGFVEEDFDVVAQFLDRVVKISIKVQDGLKNENKKDVSLDDFKKAIEKNEDLLSLREEVEKFAIKFKMPGWDVDEMKYK
jgi:glycine hydroxymethyltransferase